LALVVSIAKSSGSLTALYTLLALLGYVLLMLIVVRPVTALLVRTSHRKKMQHEALVLVLMLLFASAWTTEAIGIHAIFGGFVMGIVVPRENQFHMKVTKAIEVCGIPITHSTAHAHAHVHTHTHTHTPTARARLMVMSM
jgi:Kef-type K+ transport system membrane component KefB